MSQIPRTSTGLIHVVDDDISIQASLTALLEAAGYEVAIYGTVAAVPKPFPHNTSSCILLDIEMPGGNGMELHRQLAAQADLPPVIYLTAHGDVPASVAGLKLGALDFLQKPANPKQLLLVVAQALEQDQQRLANLAAEDAFRRRIDTLSVRERQVVGLVSGGLLNKQIARELGITLATVKVHRGRAMAKLNVESVAQLVRIADRFGLTSTSHSMAGLPSRDGQPPSTDMDDVGLCESEESGGGERSIKTLRMGG